MANSAVFVRLRSPVLLLDLGSSKIIMNASLINFPFNAHQGRVLEVSSCTSVNGNL